MLYNIYHQIYAATIKNSGFGVFYQSPGLSQKSEGMIDTIKKNAAYNPPYNDSGIDIDKYPINFAFYNIVDNENIHNVILSSRYTGATNHTPDRQGNFITHTIVFDDSITNLNIPCLIKTIPFKNSLTIDEEISFNAPSDSINYQNNETDTILSDNIRFLQSDNKYLNTFLKVIEIIIDGWLDSSGNNITICAATNKECEKLIFAIYSILPPFLINKFSFATYVLSPTKVPFQICGVIPECNIVHLDPTYFKLIDVDKQTDDYIPKYSFTKTLINWINDCQIDLIWKLDALFKDYGITAISKNIEIPFIIYEFKTHVTDKSLDDLNILLQYLLDNQEYQKNELLEYVAKNNTPLYSEYQIQITQSLISKYSSISYNISILEQKISELNKVLNHNQLLTFYKVIEQILPNKTILTSQLLTDEYPEIRQILKNNNELCSYMLKYIDQHWDSISNDDKESIVNEYSEILTTGEFYNINLRNSMSKFMNQIYDGTFIDNINNHHAIIDKLSESNKKSLFKELIEITNKNGWLTDKTIKKIILIINNYLSVDFWEKLFNSPKDIDKKNYCTSYNNIWPISLIKRHYIYNMSFFENISDCSNIIKSLDDYESKWILDKLIETHNEDGFKKISTMLPTKKEGVFSLLKRF